MNSEAEDKPPNGVIDYLNECASVLSDALQRPPFRRTPAVMRDGYEAVIELLCQPWNDIPEDLVNWRRGYEQCMLDIMHAIADEWGLPLPPSPIPE